MASTSIDPNMQQCIDECLRCYQICLHTAMNHCLEVGGRHVEPEHFRTMVNCAEICRTAAHSMLTGSHLHTYICAACAEICNACAESCKQIGSMNECVQACRTCEQSCRRMAGAQTMNLLQGGSRQSGLTGQFPM